MRQFLFIVGLTLFISCNTDKKKFDSDQWYNKTKNFILTESNLPIDSTSTENYENGIMHKLKSFNKGHLTIEKWFRETGEQVLETHYSKDGDFELRREICTNGKVAFEGVFFQKNSYGLSTWWGCGKFKQDEGKRFRNSRIGVWKHWDEKGVVSETDYKMNNLIDSLRTIKDFNDP